MISLRKYNCKESE